MTSQTTVESLCQQIARYEAQLAELRQQLAEAKQIHAHQERARTSQSYTDPITHDMSDGVHDCYRAEVYAALSHYEDRVPEPAKKKWPLEAFEYKRYGRQLIMSEIGLQGQLCLKAASVLIVGVGGLGCPAAAYLAGAGVGTIGLIDGDTVEESNLHRQVLHSTGRIGMSKVESAHVTLNAINPHVKIITHASRLEPGTALATFEPYDLVLDCTDTPASRYLISDACVLLQKPLVSASALRIDGQLMVLNNPPLPAGNAAGGPCYRCVFPKPPPPESVVSCGDGGILGPVVGTMGVLQALEAIKVLTRRNSDFATSTNTASDPPSLLIFSAYASPQFRTIRLRTRKPKCAACSSQAIVTREALTSGSLDYVQFCGIINPVDALSANERISVQYYAKLRTEINPFTGTEPTTDSHILVDVREKVQFDLCNLEGSVNVPFSTVTRFRPADTNASDNVGSGQEQDWVSELRSNPEKPIIVVCRLGNDSQVTVKKMKELGLDNEGQRWIGDLKGGLKAWRENIDRDFPEY